VLVRGDNRSLMFGGELDLDYMVTLRGVQSLASQLVVAGQGQALLTGTYVGKELKGADKDARFTRPWQHGASGGNSNIAEVVWRTMRRAGGRQCEPLDM
jgi:hypothetical protein